MLADPGKEAPMADQAIGTATRERDGRQWLRVFVVGLLLWVASVVVTFVTDNTNLVPTVILLGSFLVPVAFATYAFGRADQVVTAQAHLHRVRLRRRARGAWRLGPGGGVPQAAVGGHLPGRGAG
jgi:hypothetical protein